MIKKEYVITDEIVDMFSKCQAMANLRDLYVKLPFCYKKAVKCAVERERLNEKVWAMVYVLYSELKGKLLSYNLSEKTVVIGRGGVK